jgi:hypothetical protein
MNTNIFYKKWLFLAVCLQLTAFSGSLTVQAQNAPQRSDIFPNTGAYIVVTGMKLNEDPKNFLKDVTVAENATVKVSMKNGPSQEKTTLKFTPSRDPQDVYYTADFKILFDSTYTVEMTFKDGTRIVVDDYKIPPQWKTHFYFHSTNGTKSPATVMRRQEDAATKLNCIIYGLYPLNNYKSLGGTQLTD